MHTHVKVYVAILAPKTDEGWELEYLADVPKETDFGEIVAAVQVLYPQMIGIQIDPVIGDDNASD